MSGENVKRHERDEVQHPFEQIRDALVNTYLELSAQGSHDKFCSGLLEQIRNLPLLQGKIQAEHAYTLGRTGRAGRLAREASLLRRTHVRISREGEIGIYDIPNGHSDTIDVLLRNLGIKETADELRKSDNWRGEDETRHHGWIPRVDTGIPGFSISLQDGRLESFPKDDRSVYSVIVIFDQSITTAILKERTELILPHLNPISGTD